jgi:hypothetical protein
MPVEAGGMFVAADIELDVDLRMALIRGHGFRSRPRAWSHCCTDAEIV